MDKAKKKNIRKIIALCCVAAVVILLAAMPLLTRRPELADGPQASILSGTVETNTIETILVGGGTLAEEEAVAITVPAGVKLAAYAVNNGDAVTVGDIIAYVDPVTTMTAITQVQETLELLSQRIEAASDEEMAGNVISYAGGTVKILYAQEGDSVLDVMLEHGALAVLSLDGLMAVEFETESTLSAGETVTVTFFDGTTVTGQVKSNLSGAMIVTVEDDDYAPGEAVTVTDTDGNTLGSGELYINNPWNATAYAGIVLEIAVAEMDVVASGDTLMTLTNTGTSVTWQQLVSQRQEYEALMQELFALYQTEVITAPCDGVISGIDPDGTQLLENAQTETQDSTVSSGTNGGISGGISGGMSGSMGSFPQGGMGQPTEQELYDLTTAQIAAVTQQNTMTLSITVDELDILKLKIGQDAWITVDAITGKQFTATITDIGNNGANNGGNSKFTVQLRLDRAENMLSGMNATATITLQSTGGAASVPVAALVENGAETVIYTGYDEESGALLNPVVVTLGVSDGENVQILSGLAEGATYYYAYYDTLYISNAPNMGGGFPFGR